MKREEFLGWARTGAIVRLMEIKDETDKIFQAFPELKLAPRQDNSALKSESAAAATRSTHKHRRLSAKARKAISRRMKKYWAEQRKTQG